MFCQNCGAEINNKAVICVKCGHTVRPFPFVDPTQMAKAEEFQKTVMLCAIFGGLGVHRFYTKNKVIAWSQLTLGLFSFFIISTIWALIDLALLHKGKYKTGDGRLLTRC